MGFEMSEWDLKLLAYGDSFEKKIMSFDANVGLFDALKQCWEILANHFEPRETGIRSNLCDQFWPKNS